MQRDAARGPEKRKKTERLRSLECLRPIDEQADVRTHKKTASKQSDNEMSDADLALQRTEFFLWLL